MPRRSKCFATRRAMLAPLRGRGSWTPILSPADTAPVKTPIRGVISRAAYRPSMASPVMDHLLGSPTGRFLTIPFIVNSHDDGALWLAQDLFRQTLTPSRLLGIGDVRKSIRDFARERGRTIKVAAKTPNIINKNREFVRLQLWLYRPPEDSAGAGTRCRDVEAYRCSLWFLECLDVGKNIAVLVGLAKLLDGDICETSVKARTSIADRSIAMSRPHGTFSRIRETAV